MCSPLLGQRAILTTSMSGIELTPNYPNDTKRVPLIVDQDLARHTTIGQRGAKTTTPVAALISLGEIITSATAMGRRL
jgi:hypothetical protein